MPVNIQEIVTTVRAVDGDALVSPQVLARIVEAVLEAVEARERHEKRTRAETRVTAGVAFEPGEEDER